MYLIKLKIRKTYKQIIKFSSKKNSYKILSFFSFIESIFFPIPTDVFLVPMVIANKKKLWFLVSITTLFSVLGGLVGYAVGLYLWETITPFLNYLIPSFSEKFYNFKTVFSNLGWLFILIGGFTPFPYKVVSVSSGILELNLLLFLFFSLLSRLLRFSLVGYLVFKYESSILKALDKHTKWFLIISIIFILAYLYNKGF